jgi:choline dehydrogenase
MSLLQSRVLRNYTRVCNSQTPLAQTFGHHPMGTYKIGRRAGDALAVVDGRFRVYGVRGLRLVDASVFPISPGGFPVFPTVMVGQKGSDVILEDAQ